MSTRAASPAAAAAPHPGAPATARHAAGSPLRVQVHDTGNPPIASASSILATSARTAGNDTSPVRHFGRSAAIAGVSTTDQLPSAAADTSTTISIATAGGG